MNIFDLFATLTKGQFEWKSHFVGLLHKWSLALATWATNSPNVAWWCWLRSGAMSWTAQLRQVSAAIFKLFSWESSLDQAYWWIGTLGVRLWMSDLLSWVCYTWLRCRRLMKYSAEFKCSSGNNPKIFSLVAIAFVLYFWLRYAYWQFSLFFVVVFWVGHSQWPKLALGMDPALIALRNSQGNSV